MDDIRPPCEITDQLPVGTQNCFSTLFYTPYTNIKTSAKNAPKCTIARQKKIPKNFGEWASPDAFRTGEGDTPPQTPDSRRLRRLDSRAFGARRSRSFSFTTRTLRSIRRSVPRSVLQSPVSYSVLLRLDYGNATLSRHSAVSPQAVAIGVDLRWPAGIRCAKVWPHHSTDWPTHIRSPRRTT